MTSIHFFALGLASGFALCAVILWVGKRHKAKPFRLEYGKCYMDRLGEVRGPMRPSTRFGAIAVNQLYMDGWQEWGDSGSFCIDGRKHGRDLIREVPCPWQEGGKE